MKTAYKLDIGGKDEQQDSCGVFRKIHSTFLVLGDGMGGHKGGAVASQTLLDYAKVAYNTEAGHIADPKSFFQSIIDSTVEALQAHRADHPDTDPQTTCVLVLIQDDIVYSMHIGDSRVYILDEREYEWRTKDHSVVQMLLSLGEITEEEMATHPDQNRLLKSLNAKKSTDATYKETSLPLGRSVVLVCSDGFWEDVSVEEMRHSIFGKQIETSLEEMVLLAKERGKKRAKERAEKRGVHIDRESGDNISVVVALETIQSDREVDKPSKLSMPNNKQSKLWILIGVLLAMVSFLLFMKYSQNSEEPSPIVEVIKSKEIQNLPVDKNKTELTKDDNKSSTHPKENNQTKQTPEEHQVNNLLGVGTKVPAPKHLTPKETNNSKEQNSSENKEKPSIEIIVTEKVNQEENTLKNNESNISRSHPSCAKKA